MVSCSLSSDRFEPSATFEECQDETQFAFERSEFGKKLRLDRRNALNDGRYLLGSSRRASQFGA